MAELSDRSLMKRRSTRFRYRRSRWANSTSHVASTRHLLARQDIQPVMVAGAAAPSSNMKKIRRSLGKIPAIPRLTAIQSCASVGSGERPYQLPSEAEWEYAARAGTTTKFYWGDDDAAAPAHAWFNANSGCDKVEGLVCDHGRTHPVGTKPPNEFGLYDMAGNVWQWTEDCYDNSYSGIPADGRANDTASSDPKAKDGQGNCMRVDRGGSWMFPAWLLRPATRERNPFDYRNDIMGFRVARTLP
jgi:hypothetical protein